MKALILVDLQNDFLPGGALAVANGDQVIPVANRLSALKGKTFDLVVATQDWHPRQHKSFASNNPGAKPGELGELGGLPQVMWPDHCVQGTKGAEFAPGLDRNSIDHIVQKGTDPEVDSYSGFFDNGRKKSTGLADYLRDKGVTEVVVLGLATDYCVKFTALDARDAGLKTTLIRDGCRAVNLQAGDEDRAIEDMKKCGIQITSSESYLTNYEQAMFGVIIGRFQPFHNGHLHLIRKALETHERVAIVLGSHHAARSLRNPFTSAERKEMIAASLTKAELGRIAFVEVRDYFYKPDFWRNEVREKVRTAAAPTISGANSDKQIGLIGYEKDASTNYLKWFPEWKFVPVQRELEVDATTIRDSYFRNPTAITKTPNVAIPEAVKSWLTNFAGTNDYETLAAERTAIDAYQESWSSAPFPPVFVTADSLVVQSGHVLLIRRGKAPGKGLLALPGGFLDPNESIEDCALRELAEETTFSVEKDELRKKLVQTHVFDHPLRSSRGRTITHVHYFKLDDSGSLATFKPGDDAAETLWMPLLDLPKFENKFFEDHFHLINFFLLFGGK